MISNAEGMVTHAASGPDFNIPGDVESVLTAIMVGYQFMNWLAFGLFYPGLLWVWN